MSGNPKAINAVCNLPEVRAGLESWKRECSGEATGNCAARGPASAAQTSGKRSPDGEPGSGPDVVSVPPAKTPPCCSHAQFDRESP